MSDIIKDSFTVEYLTSAFHFDREFDRADVDASGELNKAEFQNFIIYVLEDKRMKAAAARGDQVRPLCPWCSPPAARGDQVRPLLSPRRRQCAGACS